MPNALEIALDYIGRGWNPVPVPFRQKRPIIDAWQDLTINVDNASTYFIGNAQNIGVALGAASRGLTDVDLDCPEAIAVAPYLLPRTGAIFGRPSARASHWLYVTDLASQIEQATLLFNDPTTKERLLELRIGGGGKGAQTVFPGSTHECGETIAWEESGDPATVAGNDLIRCGQLIAVACVIARAWPVEGARHDAALTVGGFLARAGLAETQIAVMIEAIARAASDREWRDRKKAAVDHADYHRKTGQGRGFPTLVALVTEVVASKIANWLDYDDESGDTPKPKPKPDSAHSWDEPDWSLLDDRRGDLPEFVLENLHSVPLQDWVSRAAHGVGVSVGHVAVPLLGIASSLIGTARRVQASRSWFQPLTSWVALVGFSGSGKTPAIDATKRALVTLERTRKTMIDELRRAHEARAETAKLQQAQWRDQLKAAIEDGTPPPPKPPGADEVGKFVTPRLYISNATIERLGVLLQARPQGLLMLADELAGLFLNMSRYTTGQDNEFWLEAWNGNPYVLERMNRPAISLDHLLIGIAGGLQPDKLAKCFEGDEDGMYARILFAWPEEPAYQPLSNAVAEVEPEIANALARLSKLGGDDPEAPIIQSIPLSAHATEILEYVRLEVFEGKAVLDGRERDWWSKMPAHVLRLAGTLCYLDWAMVGGPEPKEVGANFIGAAATLARDYFWPHTRAALRLIGLSDRHADARRVLRWIKGNGCVAVSLKDIRRDALAHKLDADETEELINRLERAGWLRKTIEKHAGAGRPSVRWTVNPQLLAEQK